VFYVPGELSGISAAIEKVQRHLHSAGLRDADDLVRSAFEADGALKPPAAIIVLGKPSWTVEFRDVVSAAGFAPAIAKLSSQDSKRDGMRSSSLISKS
jgi:hypothetical protein